MAEARRKAVRGALRSGDELGALFARMGDADHPRGAILTAYRTARNALRGRVGNARAVEDALATLRAVVQANATTLLSDAAGLGVEQAVNELRLYGATVPAIDITAQQRAALLAWLAALDMQIGAVRALAFTGDEAEILGDAARAGVLTPGPVTQAGAKWLASIMLLGWATTADQGGKGEFLKQAVAAIDERTTDCCLRVNGQTQPLDKPFHLTGEPRFADYIDDPPFHWYCRTALTLVPREHAGDDVTREMREAAQAERRTRAETGERREIHPAHSTSRRAG